MHESIRRTCSRLRSVINLETIRFCGILLWGGLLMCDTAHAQMSRELELQVQAISGCPPSESPLLSRIQEPQLEAGLAVWVKDCAGGEEAILLMLPASGDPIEVDRRPLAGIFFEAELVPYRDGPLAIVSVSSNEPNEVQDNYLLDLYDASDGSLLFSASSRGAPTVKLLGNDGLVIVVYKDVTAAPPHAGVPSWPIVVKFDGVAFIDDLAYHPDVIDAAQTDAQTQLEFVKNVCPGLPDPCRLAPVIDILERRLSVLESIKRFRVQ